MATITSYNLRNPAVKRLLQEARELQQDQCCDYTAQPLEPNGRFELNKKICLSITGFHPEYWLPAWGIRTVLLGLIGFLTTKANGAIGGIDYTENERRILAQSNSDADQSLTYNKSKADDYMPQFSFLYDEERNTNTANSSNTPKDSDSKETMLEYPNSELNNKSTNIVSEQHQLPRDIIPVPSQRPSRLPRSTFIIDALIATLVAIMIALIVKKLL
ncbi:16181_t:CDS:2 [Acaulospora colombiana]|uniref:16181_t:CDS:1 n=1 Tax=Acaulospora colombiana TaxID=27376 RepID=A0ACA9M5M9_9GLOM|nr:16181_t:CDS:2 [Acaulospora colombiana]